MKPKKQTPAQLRKRLTQGQREAKQEKGKDLDQVMKELDELLSTPR